MEEKINKAVKTSLEITEEEKNAIINNSARDMPLNPTAQGWSGKQVREKLYKAICGNNGEDGSVLALFINYFGLKDINGNIIKQGLLNGILDKIEEDLSNVKTKYLKSVEYDTDNFILKFVNQEDKEIIYTLPFSDVYYKIKQNEEKVEALDNNVNQYRCDLQYNNIGLMYVDTYDRIKGRIKIAYNPSLIRSMEYDKATGKLKVSVRPKDYSCNGDNVEPRPSCAFDTIKYLDIGISEEEIANIKVEIGDGIANTITMPITLDVLNRVNATLEKDYVKTNQKGAINGVATLDNEGKVPSSQLPSYVDDVVEGTLTSSVLFTATDGTEYSGVNASGKIFIDVNTNTSYRWSGTQFTQVGGGGGGGSFVEMNNGQPTTDTAKTIKVNDVNYELTQVKVNSLEPTTDVAKAIQVNDKNYSFPSASMTFSDTEESTPYTLKTIKITDDRGYEDIWNLAGFELEYANSYKLGGIKADMATPQDTQPVRMGDDGKLYTQPGSGGDELINPDYISTFSFQTTAPSTTITFNLFGPIGKDIGKVDWGDGTVEVINTNFGNTISHTYNDVYDIFITLYWKGNIDSMNVVGACFDGIKIGKRVGIDELSGSYDILERLFEIERAPIKFISYLSDNFTYNNVVYIKNISISKDVNITSGQNGLFSGFSKLKYIAPILFNFGGSELKNMFSNCGNLIEIPMIYTGDYTDIDASNMFASCYSLTKIPAIDAERITNMQSMFEGCRNIQEINMININADLDISMCEKMQQYALHKVIDNLKEQYGTTRYLTLGSTLLARVSEEYKQIAINKGWTLY